MLTIMIPAQEHVNASNVKWEASSPAVQRLLAYDKENCPWTRSPEDRCQEADQASKRARFHLKQVSAKAKAHNEEAAERARRRLILDEVDKERVRESLRQKEAAALQRRLSWLDSRRRLSRERQNIKEVEVKSALARKAKDRAKRTELHRQRCHAAELLREQHLRQIQLRSQQSPVSKPTPTVNSLSMMPDLELDSHALGIYDCTVEAAARHGDASPIENRSGMSESGRREQGPESDLRAASLHLLAEIDSRRQAAAWDSLAEWVQSQSTVDLVQSILIAHGAHRQGNARLVLVMITMHLEARSMFDCEASHDKIMRREANRFMRQLKHSLSSGFTTASQHSAKLAVNEPLSVSLTRVGRFYHAWAYIDRPLTTDALLATLVVMNAREAEAGDSAHQMDISSESVTSMSPMHAGDSHSVDVVAAPVPAPETPVIQPEHIFSLLGAIGGAEVETEGRARYAGRWHQVRASRLVETVTEVATRAYWDAVNAEIASGRYDALWDVLTELQHAMRALASSSVISIEDLDDKFDVAWLRTQVEHGALETAQVHHLMKFLMATISSWQAPADDADTSAWVALTEAYLLSTSDMPLGEFIQTYLVRFIRGAIERVGQVYKRTMEMVTEREVAAAEEQRLMQQEVDTSEAAQQD